MSDYLTKIARAICKARYGFTPPEWDWQGDTREYCERLARAALLAALEPDEAMIEAGASEYKAWRRDDDITAPEIRIFRAMIQQALKGGE